MALTRNKDGGPRWKISFLSQLQTTTTYSVSLTVMAERLSRFSSLVLKYYSRSSPEGVGIFEQANACAPTQEHRLHQAG
jgi:hypothetical protein